MALTAKARAAIPRSKFALPGGTKASKKPAFPVDTKKRAESALQLVTKSLNAGNITPSQAATVKAKARAKLGTKASPPRKAAAKRSR